MPGRNVQEHRLGDWTGSGRRILHPRSSPKAEAQTARARGLGGSHRYRHRMGEGVADAAARELPFFERGGRVTFLADDARGGSIREGSRVRGPAEGARFGQLLARLDKRVDALEMAQAEAGVRGIRGELTAARAAVRGLEATLRNQEGSLSRSQALYAAGALSLADLQAEDTAVRQTRAELRGAQSRVDSARSELGRLGAQRDAASVGLEKTALFAPFDGRITRMNVRVGDLVPPPSKEK